jgi:bifunctional ADP-heptose synthase (sugar kinase/adenylyltransferase)
MDTRVKIVDAGTVSDLPIRNSNGTRWVVARGWFDILRSAHCRSLAEAKAQGGKLAVLVRADSDDPPTLLDQSSRAQLVAALAAVDYVVICDGTQADLLAEAWKPDAIFDIDEAFRNDLVREVVQRHRPA